MGGSQQGFSQMIYRSNYLVLVSQNLYPAWLTCCESGCCATRPLPVPRWTGIWWLMEGAPLLPLAEGSQLVFL